MSGAVNGAVDFYDTTDPSVAGWGIVGGTSEASPLFSGIVALADQVAGHSLGDLNPALYAMGQRRVPDGIVPISQGSNTYTYCVAADIASDASCASSPDLMTVRGFHANGSYNAATGWAPWMLPCSFRPWPASQARASCPPAGRDRSGDPIGPDGCEALGRVRR
jgi:hypothetical protein